jgi:hypothetical protein
MKDTDTGSMYGKFRTKPVLYLLMLSSAFLFISCEKDHFFDFLKSTGKNLTIEREVSENFTKVKLENNIDLVLTQGPSYKITLEGGENLLPGIDTEIKDSMLTIRNNNKFNWVRSYDKKIIAYVTAPYFLQLGYEGTGTITNNDTLREDSLFINAYGGSGYITLCIKTRISHMAINYGSADINISGTSDNNFIYAGSFGPFHCLDLVTKNTYMTNKGTNDCYINVTNHLEYDIKGLGNIYYSGNPLNISGSSSGEGRLIKL